MAHSKCRICSHGICSSVAWRLQTGSHMPTFPSVVYRALYTEPEMVIGRYPPEKRPISSGKAYVSSEIIT